MKEQKYNKKFRPPQKVLLRLLHFNPRVTLDLPIIKRYHDTVQWPYYEMAG